MFENSNTEFFLQKENFQMKFQCLDHIVLEYPYISQNLKKNIALRRYVRKFELKSFCSIVMRINFPASFLEILIVFSTFFLQKSIFETSNLISKKSKM